MDRHYVGLHGRTGQRQINVINGESKTQRIKGKIRMEETTNLLNETIMSKEMNWDNFVPTREIREYDMKLRESIRQREQLKLELAELEKRGKDLFYDVEHEMLETGIRYFDVRSEFYVYKVVLNTKCWKRV